MMRRNLDLEMGKKYMEREGKSIRFYHRWFVRTLRTKKTERTLRTKKPKAHFYFPEIKYKVTIHIIV